MRYKLAAVAVFLAAEAAAYTSLALLTLKLHRLGAWWYRRALVLGDRAQRIADAAP